MASYHTSFTYKDKNSFDEGYIIVAFDPDDGFKDTYLTMENISDEYHDNTKRFDYGAKYSSQAEVHITLIKKDGTDMSVKDFRSCAKWLTGARTNSWLDMYVGDTIIYSFLGKFLNLEQYKLDARTVGVRLTFSSLSPWAYSSLQVFDCLIGQSLFVKDATYKFYDVMITKTEISNQTISYRNTTSMSDLSLYQWDTVSYSDSISYNSGSIILVDPTSFIMSTDSDKTIVLGKYIRTGYDNNYYFIPPDSKFTYSKNKYGGGEYIRASSAIKLTIEGTAISVNGNALCKTEDNTSDFGLDGTTLILSPLDEGNNFSIDNSGIVYIDTSYSTTIDNKSDDIYTYIYLDIDYENKIGDKLYIKNNTLNEETIVTDIGENEKISISANQFITSDKPNKIFGDTFNFIWPRLAPGINDLNIYGAGTGRAQFAYRYPIKIGDCTMDIDIDGNSIICDDCTDNDNEVFNGTIAWSKITNKPTTIKGYGITDAYTMDEVDDKISGIEIGDGTTIGNVTVNESELNAMLDEVLG